MSRRKNKGTPWWLDLLVGVVVIYALIQLVTNPDVHLWLEFHCGWFCR